MNAVSQQSVGRQDGPQLQKACPYRLRSSVCKEKQCDKFHKMLEGG